MTSYSAQNWLHGTGEFVRVSINSDTNNADIKPSDVKSKNLLLPGIVDLHAVVQPLIPNVNESQAALANGITSLLAMPGCDAEHRALFYSLPKCKYVGQQARVYRCLPLSEVCGNTRIPLDYMSLDKEKIRALLISDQDLLHTKALLRCLQLAKESKIRVFIQPNWAPLCQRGQVHQGKLAAVKGLDAVSPSAETIALRLVLELIRDTGTALHCTGITSARSLDIIEQAKKEGLSITADTAITHLLFSDQDIRNFDTRFKLWPPLRSEDDKKALLQGVNTGVIDAVSSFHTPQSHTDKHLPFASASYGAASFDTFVPMLVSLLNSGALTPEILRQCCALNPAKILGIDNSASMIVETDTSRSMDGKDWLSAGKNSPWFQKEQTAYGKITLIST